MGIGNNKSEDKTKYSISIEIVINNERADVLESIQFYLVCYNLNCLCLTQDSEILNFKLK